MWYVLLNDEQFGPMHADELKSMLEQGLVNGGSLIWREGMDDWITIQESELRGWNHENEEESASDN